MQWTLDTIVSTEMLEYTIGIKECLEPKILSKLIVSNLFILWLINVKENLELDTIDNCNIQNYVQSAWGKCKVYFNLQNWCS